MGVEIMCNSLEVNRLVKWFKIGRVTGLGPQKIQKLLTYFGNLNSIFSATNSELLQTRIFNEKMLDEFNKLKEASENNFIKNIEDCKQKKIEIITIMDKKYPKELIYISSPPLTLFLLGDINLLNNNKKIAIVGSRKPTQNAINYAYSLSRFLSENKFTIVSGGALGIDTNAHKGALETDNGKTISVVGAGFNNMYPPENLELFNKIKQRGLLISEHLPNFNGSRISYLQRNRITSGISNTLFSVASSKTGGSLTQMGIAFKQRKPIFCPSLDDKIMPNEGIKEAVLNYNAREISNKNDLLKILENPLESLLMLNK